jgi:DNA-binding NarL/FixJ family response regulator
VRHGLVQLIDQEPDLVVCGQAEDTRKALAAVKSLNPDLVVTDLSMPGNDSLEYIKQMCTSYPSLKVLVLSIHDEEIYAERVLRGGARGYIMKNAGGNKLLEAIRRVLTGKVYLSEEMSAKILNSYGARRKRAGYSKIGNLTDREFEVFQLIGQGMITREIGQQLHMSPKTVDTHRRHIRERLRLDSNAELTRYALRWAVTEDLI